MVIPGIKYFKIVETMFSLTKSNLFLVCESFTILTFLSNLGRKKLFSIKL